MTAVKVITYRQLLQDHQIALQADNFYKNTEPGKALHE